MAAWMTTTEIAAIGPEELLTRLAQSLSRHSVVLVRDGRAILDTETGAVQRGPWEVTTVDLLVEVEELMAALDGTDAVPTLAAARSLALDGWLNSLPHGRGLVA